MSCGVGSRHSLNLALLWLWCRLEAIVLIRPLAWEPPYAAGEALKGHTHNSPPKQNKTTKLAKLRPDDYRSGTLQRIWGIGWGEFDWKTCLFGVG